MIKVIHKTAALLATLSVFVFFASSLLVEGFGSYHSIAAVKQAVLMPGLVILIPSIMAAGITGLLMAKNVTRGVIGRKKKRMPILAINGLVILVPSAFFLNEMAMAGNFGTSFYALQAVELVAGGLNLTLLIRNMMDGRKLSGKSA